MNTTTSPTAAFEITFTDRQRAVALATAEGRDARATAVLLGLTPGTVTSYLRFLAAKLHTRRSNGVVGQSLRLGLLRPDPDAPLPLSEHDLTVLSLLADGCARREIGALMCTPRPQLGPQLDDLAQRLHAVTPAHMLWRAVACGADPDLQIPGGAL